MSVFKSWKDKHRWSLLYAYCCLQLIRPWIQYRITLFGIVITRQKIFRISEVCRIHNCEGTQSSFAQFTGSMSLGYSLSSNQILISQFQTMNIASPCGLCIILFGNWTNAHVIDDKFHYTMFPFCISFSRLLLVAYLVCTLLQIHPMKAGFVAFNFFYFPSKFWYLLIPEAWTGP